MNLRHSRKSFPDRKHPIPGVFSLLFSLSLIIFILSLSGCMPSLQPLPSPPPKPVEAATFTPLPTLKPIPSATPVPVEPTEPPCTESRGQIVTEEVPSTRVSNPIMVNVYTPPCYELIEDTQLPVIYLLHGQSFKQNQWERLGATLIADKMIRSVEIPPFLIVMPFEAYSLQEPKESVYGEAIADEIVPWVDEHYATCAERECRLIAGLSRGAAWAMRLAFVRWELFGAVAGHSFPPFRGDWNMFPSWLSKIPREQYPKVYLDTGTNDQDLSATVQFMGLLNRYLVPFEWHLNEGSHTEEYWSAHVEEYMDWYVHALFDLDTQGKP